MAAAAIPIASSVLGAGLGFLGSGRAGKAIGDAAIAGEHGVLNAAAGGASGVTTALGENSSALTAAAQEASGNVSNYTNYALKNLNPFISGGQQGADALTAYALSNPQFNFQPTMAQLEQTPGYQFALTQGLNATGAKDAAMGAGNGSNADYDKTAYATGLASQYYQNAFNNAQSAFQTNQNTTLANLSTLTNQGLNAAGLGNTDIMQTGIFGGNATLGAAQTNAQQNLQGNEFNANLGLTAAEQAGNLGLTAGAARASGILGQYNSLAGGAAGLGGLAGAFGGYNPMGNVNMTNVNAGLSASGALG